MFHSKNLYGIKLSRILGLKKFIKTKKIKKENNKKKSIFFVSSFPMTALVWDPIAVLKYLLC